MKKFLVLLPLLVTLNAQILRFGMQANTQSNSYKMAELFSNEVEKNSKGEIRVEIFPSGQLGDDREMLKQVKKGTLDITIASSARFDLFFEDAGVLTLPYLITDFKTLQKVLFETNFGKKLQGQIASLNMVILGQSYSGARDLSSNRPINSIKDVKGLKLRTPNASANINFARYIGAIVTPIPFQEVYLALKTNAIDAQENPISTIYAMKFYEAQKYLAITHHIINDDLILMNSTLFSSLSNEHKKIVQDAAQKAAKYGSELFFEDEQKYPKLLQDHGVTITYPKLDEFKKAMEPYWQSFVKKTNSKDVLDEILKLNEK